MFSLTLLRFSMNELFSIQFERAGLVTNDGDDRLLFEAGFDEFYDGSVREWTIGLLCIHAGHEKREIRSVAVKILFIDVGFLVRAVVRL